MRMGPDIGEYINFSQVAKQTCIFLKRSSNSISSKYTRLFKKYKLTPVENQSPSGVGVIKDRMASTIDTEVDAADDLPHF
jgi:hypothetical protein